MHSLLKITESNPVWVSITGKWSSVPEGKMKSDPKKLYQHSISVFLEQVFDLNDKWKPSL